MKLILIDGGPASGKNTLGTLLVEKLKTTGENVILLDLDSYVERINPSWIWSNKDQERQDQLKARENFAKEIDDILQKDAKIIVIGERFLNKDDVTAFLKRLNTICPTFLFHLSIPIEIRKSRLEKRGPHSLIDLEKDQKDRDNIKVWPGYVYKNINLPEIDANNIMKLIQDGKGMIDLTTNRSEK